ncbi:DUF262 domain-containing protein [Alkalibacterium sp.]
MKRVDAHETTLKGYLGIESDIGELTIPFSQRPYEWNKAEVERLFNDLVSLYYDDENIHMLNFFTLSGEGGMTKIFDGQQRTITSLLIVGVFIKKLNSRGLLEAAKQLHNQYIEKVEYISDDGNIRKLRFDDKETENFFYKLLSIKNDVDLDSKNYENETIKTFITNFNLITQLLDRFIDKNDLNRDEIRKMVNRILTATNLITIKTDTDELAMAMFESLNNTGKQLENYYVLKNDLVIALEEKAVKDKWNEIESNLANFDQSDFLVAFATVLTGKSTKKNALSKIYTKYSKQNRKEMIDLLNILLAASEKYLHLRNPAQLTDYKDRTAYDNYRENISNLNLFIKKQQLPLLLAAMMKGYSLSNINEIATHLLNIGIRNLYFEEKRANTIEILIADLANDIYTETKSIKDVLNVLKKEALSDSEVKEAIKGKIVKRGQAEKNLKFILRETYNTTDLQRELKIRDNLSEIHYEHILPKRPSQNSQWIKDFSVEEEREIYTSKVGNATLLLDKINTNISNKDFKDKKLRYKESHIPENKNIANHKKWTTIEIENRTTEIAEKIITYLNELTN